MLFGHLPSRWGVLFPSEKLLVYVVDVVVNSLPPFYVHCPECYSVISLVAGVCCSPAKSCWFMLFMLLSTRFPPLVFPDTTPRSYRVDSILFWFDPLACTPMFFISNFSVRLRVLLCLRFLRKLRKCTLNRVVANSHNSQYAHMFFKSYFCSLSMT
jgi:hypothetical protein